MRLKSKEADLKRKKCSTRHIGMCTRRPQRHLILKGKTICVTRPYWTTLWVKSLVVDGREGSRILLSSLWSMEVVSQSEGRWFEVCSLPSSFQTTSNVASTAASRVSRSDGKS